MELLGFGRMHGGRVVTGAPFSAIAVSETTQALSDGNKILNKTQTSLYRDSQGRFRKEVTMPAFGDATQSQPHSFVFVHDPVASTGFILNPEKKVAHLMPGSRGGKDKHPGNAADASAFENRNDANVTKESLGTQTINGVSAQGTRFTRTIPAGNMGNEKPITIVREEWYSPDLQLIVQSKRNDPRFGETTYTLTNIQRTEPAASLFTVPSDYTVKEDGPHGGMKRHGKKGVMPPTPGPDAPPPAPGE
jgi:hypothetical protein